MDLFEFLGSRENEIRILEIGTEDNMEII